MKIALFGKPFDINFKKYAIELFEKFKQHNSDIIIYREFYDFLIKKTGLDPKVTDFFTDPIDIKDGMDFMISIGGDGTFLESVSFVRDKGVPIIGLNSGRLGFLANISKEEISDAIDALYRKDYTFEKRALIKFQVKGGTVNEFPYALNDIVIHKVDSAMIIIHTYINNELLNSYWADGLIISTPTGSTAYSMSVGGPIILPCSDNFIISPIAPHNLTVRPVVVSSDVKISIRVECRCGKFMATIDNRSRIISVDDEILLSLAEFQINMLKFKNNSFYNTLRNKLMWGADKRNI